MPAASYLDPLFCEGKYAATLDPICYVQPSATLTNMEQRAPPRKEKERFVISSCHVSVFCGAFHCGWFWLPLLHTKPRPQITGRKQQMWPYAPGFCGSGMWMEASREGLSLPCHIEEDLKLRVT